MYPESPTLAYFILFCYDSHFNHIRQVPGNLPTGIIRILCMLNADAQTLSIENLTDVPVSLKVTIDDDTMSMTS